MKKALITIFALSTLCSTAQRASKEERIGEWRHQISVGAGLHDITLWGEEKFGGFRDAYGKSYITDNWRRAMDIIPSVEYSYRVIDALEVVGAFTFERATSNYIDKNTSKFVGDMAVNVYTLGLSARYTWLNTKYFRLYSTIGYTSHFAFHRNTVDGITSNSMRYVPQVAFVPIGFRAGRQLFFFGEALAYTSRGTLFVAGVGCRF